MGVLKDLKKKRIDWRKIRIRIFENREYNQMVLAGIGSHLMPFGPNFSSMNSSSWKLWWNIFLIFEFLHLHFSFTCISISSTCMQSRPQWKRCNQKRPRTGRGKWGRWLCEKRWPFFIFFSFLYLWKWGRFHVAFEITLYFYPITIISTGPYLYFYLCFFYLVHRGRRTDREES